MSTNGMACLELVKDSLCSLSESRLGIRSPKRRCLVSNITKWAKTTSRWLWLKCCKHWNNPTSNERGLFQDAGVSCQALWRYSGLIKETLVKGCTHLLPWRMHQGPMPQALSCKCWPSSSRKWLDFHKVVGMSAIKPSYNRLLLKVFTYLLKYATCTTRQLWMVVMQSSSVKHCVRVACIMCVCVRRV